jgi:hypothetical protein
VDLFFNAVLTASSLLLLCYWFRYTCLLILAAEPVDYYTAEIVEANQLAFPEVRARLRRNDATTLEYLHESLERDFAVLAGLLQEHNTRVDPGIEEAMLTIHFRTLSASFRLTHRHLRASAADALEEMTRVVTHLANQLGQHQTTANLQLHGITVLK